MLLALTLLLEIFNLNGGKLLDIWSFLSQLLISPLAYWKSLNCHVIPLDKLAIDMIILSCIHVLQKVTLDQ